jgi:PleD family two-component response regulator
MEKTASVPREKILIVDDTSLYRAVAADILTRRGYIPIEADSGLRALDVVASENPDLVILDARMPGLDGPDVLHRLKGNLFTQQIPVLLVTGDSKPTESADLGRADDFIGKPLNAAELVAHVQALLQSSSRANRVTRLPSARALRRRIKTRLAQNIPTAVVYADIDNFQAYNRVYGELAGDKVLMAAAQLMTDTLPDREAFAAHLGEDDLIALLKPEPAETYVQTLIDRFLGLRSSFHSSEDLARGYFLVPAPRGEPREVPLVSLSAVLVTNAQRALTNYVQVSDHLVQVMQFLKAQGGGSWARDRRTG